jgi:hypothetical protein
MLANTKLHHEKAKVKFLWIISLGPIGTATSGADMQSIIFTKHKSEA